MIFKSLTIIAYFFVLNNLFRFRNYEVENVLEGKPNFVYENDIELIDGSLGIRLTLMDY